MKIKTNYGGNNTTLETLILNYNNALERIKNTMVTIREGLKHTKTPDSVNKFIADLKNIWEMYIGAANEILKNLHKKLPIVVGLIGYNRQTGLMTEHTTKMDLYRSVFRSSISIRKTTDVDRIITVNSLHSEVRKYKKMKGCLLEQLKNTLDRGFHKLPVSGSISRRTTQIIPTSSRR